MSRGAVMVALGQVLMATGVALRVAKKSTFPNE
jgi:hypothetical protein